MHQSLDFHHTASEARACATGNLAYQVENVLDGEAGEESDDEHEGPFSGPLAEHRIST